jgi:hypothetical protein
MDCGRICAQFLFQAENMSKSFNLVNNFRADVVFSIMENGFSNSKMI